MSGSSLRLFNHLLTSSIPSSRCISKSGASRWFSTRRDRDLTRPAFCFDIDGVLKKGSSVLPEAKEALRILSGHNAEGHRFPFILCTNGGGLHESDRCQKLTNELGVPISPKLLIQSHTVFNQFAPLYHDKAVLVVGGASDCCRKIAEAYGFSKVYTPQDFLRWNSAVWPFYKLSEREVSKTKHEDMSKIPFSAIFVMHDPFDWGLATQVSIDLLTSTDGIITNPIKFSKGSDTLNHMPIYFSNPDFIWGNEFCRPRFGQGAFQIALRENYRRLTGQELKGWVGGKPSRETYQFADRLLNDIARLDGDEADKRNGNVYMIGDNPASDIQGANNHGWKSVLVQTGVFTGKNPTDSEFPPTAVQPNVLDAVKWALMQEGYRV